MPAIEGCIRIDVTSGSRKKVNGLEVKSLSPFVLGPVMTGTDEECKLFENFWQYGKKYLEKNHIYDRNKWLSFRTKGFASTKACRRPVPGKKAVSSEYFGVEMDYITSRKQVYAPIYKKLVEDLPVVHALRELLKKTDLLIVEYDGPKIPEVATQENMEKAIEDPSQPFGHGYVLAGVLLGLNVNFEA